MGELDASLRVLARHQWVREHGTPRVTTLAGPVGAGRALWTAWLTANQRTVDEQAMLAAPRGAAADWLTTAATRAFAIAVDTPAQPVALLVAPDALSAWLRARADRLAVFVAEGVVEVGAVLPPIVAPARPAVARSRAERLMFDALEAQPATAGRFQLNQPLSFHFGGRAVEVDLLARGHDLAIEIDGYRHFTDPAAYRRDRAKDRELQAHGYAVLRFLADDVLADAAALARTVVTYLGTAAGARRPKKR